MPNKHRFTNYEICRLLLQKETFLCIWDLFMALSVFTTRLDPFRFQLLCQVSQEKERFNSSDNHLLFRDNLYLNLEPKYYMCFSHKHFIIRDQTGLGS